MRWDDRQDNKWDDRWEFARLIYDIQNILWSYNLIILQNQDTQIQFRNCCKAEAQSNLQSIYITMWDNKTKQINRQRQYEQILPAFLNL